MDFDNSWDALIKPWRSGEYFAADPLPAFDPSASEYRPANSFWLAELSRLVYRDRDREPFLRAAGLREARFLEHGSTQCAIVRRLEPGDEDFAAVVFRGTSELRDWWANLRAIPASWPPGGKVHRGFRSAFDRVWDAAEEVLGELDVPVFYAGHSLGGALATLAASREPPRAAYTFGAPRVGDAAFGRTLASAPVYRVVNRRDVVPTVPPPNDVLGFRHAGELCQILGAGRMVRGTVDRRERGARADEDDPCAVRRWFDPAAFLADHAPINYAAHLARLL